MEAKTGSSNGRPPALLVLDSTDTVGVALADLTKGTSVTAPGRQIVVRSDIRAGHKVALVDAQAGTSVQKFGVDIGTATVPIVAGDHVHVHNLESERMRGDR